MSNSPIEWLAKLHTYPDYPNGLADFLDARTVRIMLTQVNDWIAEDSRMLGTIQGGHNKATWASIWATDLAKYREAKVQLEDWLATRGLTL